MSYFSNNLRFLRERLNIKQDAFEQIGIKKGTYSNYENGKTEPNIETLMSISKFLGIDLNSLICSDLAGMSEEDFLKNINIIENNGNLNGNLNGNPTGENTEKCTCGSSDMPNIVNEEEKSAYLNAYQSSNLVDNQSSDSKNCTPSCNPTREKTEKSTLGLDLGAPSIGWALVNESLPPSACEPNNEFSSKVSVKLRKEQTRIPELLAEQTRTSVPFYNLPVSAGQLGVLESEVFSHTEPDGFVELGVFEGCEAVFPIIGISMEPIISSGDWIGIKTIDNISHSWEFLQTGVIYLIITREERMIKFIEKATDENFIVCKSPNYSPFKVFKGDILKLYRVKACSKRL